MIGANPFFKKPSVRTMEVKPEDTEKGRAEIRGRLRRLEHNNRAVVPVDGHPRFGFQTILDREVKPLPTAPPIVGGNVDWTKSKMTPATKHLHSVLAERRAMNPSPALGTPLKLGEPSRDSIHADY